MNSIRARLPRVLEWLQAQRPDVLCMQETKCLDELFPVDAFREAGYEVAVYGQKTYNGVAILATSPLEAVTRGFEEGDEMGDARLLGATVRGVRVYSAYVPNGQIVGSPAWDIKLRWLERVRRRLDVRHTTSERLVLCGDFNVAPEERDVYDPEYWKTQVLFHPTARAALQRVCEWGLVDTLRLHHEEGGLYSWWDYRQLSFPKNLGLRIDHILASPPLASACSAAFIDRQARKGAGASDHAPVVADFEL